MTAERIIVVDDAHVSPTEPGTLIIAGVIAFALILALLAVGIVVWWRMNRKP